jgi:hypothetical protein
MIYTNDLIGLEYGWGHRPGDGSGKTDCFQLVCEVRRRMGFGEYGPMFEWVYSKFNEETLPKKQIAKWLLSNGSRCNEPFAGATVLLPGISHGALGTYVNSSDVVFISLGSNVIRVPLANAGYIFSMNR